MLREGLRESIESKTEIKGSLFAPEGVSRLERHPPHFSTWSHLDPSGLIFGLAAYNGVYNGI